MKKSSYLPDAMSVYCLQRSRQVKQWLEHILKQGKSFKKLNILMEQWETVALRFPQMKNKIAYEIALGDDEEADLGAVLAFDISHDSYKRIDFGRNNITETKVDGRYLYYQ